MKTFIDLEFTQNENTNMRRAYLEFNNGYGVSVINGKYAFTDNDDQYELAVLLDGNICYDSSITNDVVGRLSKEGVTDLMEAVQELKPINKHLL